MLQTLKSMPIIETKVWYIHNKEHEAKSLDDGIRGFMSLQNMGYITLKSKCGVQSHSFLGHNDYEHQKSDRIHSFHNMLYYWCGA